MRNTSKVDGEDDDDDEDDFAVVDILFNDADTEAMESSCEGKGRDTQPRSSLSGSDATGKAITTLEYRFRGFA